MNINIPSSSHQMADVFLFSSVLLLSGVANLYMLPSYIMRGNVPGICILLWLFFSNTLLAINTVLPTNVLLYTPFYCDVVTKIFLSMQLAVPAGMLCFALDLHYYIVTCDSPYQYERQKWVRNLMHMLFCLFVPLLYVALHIVVQDHRFDVVREFGCLPAAQTTFPAFLAIWIPLALFTVAIPAYLKWHQYRLKRQYWLNEVDNPRYIEMELVMSYPVGSLKNQRRLMKTEYIVAAWATLLFASALIIYLVAGFVPYSKPDFTRIDVFDTLGNFPGYLGPIHALLWSGPVYTFFFFYHNSKKQLFMPYSLLVERIYRLSDRDSFLEFELNWRFNFLEKGLVRKAPRKEVLSNPYRKDKFTELPKRVERKSSRLMQAKAKAKETANALAERLDPPKNRLPRRTRSNPWATDRMHSMNDVFFFSINWTEENRPVPTVLKYKPSTYDMPPPTNPPNSPEPRPRPKRVQRPEPAYQGWVVPHPSAERRRQPKQSRAQETKRVRKIMDAYRREKANPPLFTIPESPLTGIQDTEEQVYGPIIPLTKEELIRERQVEEEDARIRAEMRANRF